MARPRHRGGEGIIPAYAGSTWSPVRPTGSAYGSSPHTRGARSARPSCCSRTWDHPRIRGEHPHRPEDVEAAPRIIPAYAGSTSKSKSKRKESVGSSPHTRGALCPGTSRAVGEEDHPRIRGEHDGLDEPTVEVGGIIPAYAGSTEGRGRGVRCGRGSSPHTRGAREDQALGRGLHQDHPRIRGEHLLLGAAVAQLQGIIPAYAGSTAGARVRCVTRGGSSPHTRGAPRRWPPPYPCRRDHPRIRGEHVKAARSTVFMSGSSPHTRGALVRRLEYVGYLGIIPAYAGST